LLAEVPALCPDVLIVESTYGVQIHEPRTDRERRFVQAVYDIVHTRQGHCLIPVFALGRAQELLLILEEFWQAHPELHSVPIYYASSLGKKAMTVYQTYVNMMNSNIRQMLSNPFAFQYIKSVKSIENVDYKGPCVVMASPGMLQSGLSRELFEMWCEDQRNGVVLTAYCVEGTLAKLLLQDPTEIPTLSGRTVPLRMSVHYISFSAHSDYQQTSGFIDILRPPNVILVHGEKNEMQRLRNALQTRYEGQNLRILTPKNCQTVQLPFKGELTAKALGEIVSSAQRYGATTTTTQHGQRLQGLLVEKDFRYHLFSPNDLHTYTRLHATTLTQKLRVPLQLPLATLQRYVTQLFDENEVQLTTTRRGKPALSIANAVHIVAKFVNTNDTMIISNEKTLSPFERSPHHIVIEWISNEINDMIADSIIALLGFIGGVTRGTNENLFQFVDTPIKTEQMEIDIKQNQSDIVHKMEIQIKEEKMNDTKTVLSSHSQRAQQILTLLTAHFGQVTHPQPHLFLIEVDGARAVIDFEHRVCPLI
jgi:cleavage and polyadenylation specificity factor subunit 3